MAEIIRCPHCGHRKDKWNQLCEACHRYPPERKENATSLFASVAGHADHFANYLAKLG